MTKLKKIVRSIVEKIQRLLIGPHVQKSYSQEGEDMILRRIFDGRSSGLYVDVGAHHPKRFSNTHNFYLNGWRGINIEPNPDARSIFSTVRKHDVNLQLGVSDVAGTLTYYLFDEPALNTFDEVVVKQRLSNTRYKVVSKASVPVMRLDHIFIQYLPKNVSIDFLTIDVEGFDYSVLKSNDWQRFRPKIVLVEELGRSLEEIMAGEIFTFMKENKYSLIAKTFNTLFFEDRADE